MEAVVVADPVRTNLESMAVFTGFATRETQFRSLRADINVALTELDYGDTASIPVVPELSQLYMDTDVDALYLSWDGTTFSGIASLKVKIDDDGITMAADTVLTCGDGLVLPVGNDKWVRL